MSEILARIFSHVENMQRDDALTLFSRLPDALMERYPFETAALGLKTWLNCDEKDYLARYPDVKASGMDVVEHFVKYGINENRSMKLLENETGKSLLQIRSQGSVEALFGGGDRLHVDWLITDMCNYKCSYCFGQKPLDKKQFMPLAKLKNAVDHISSLNRKSLSVTLVGGEPTTHPDLFPLIEYIEAKCADNLSHITIVTNGSNNNEIYENLAGIAQHINFNLIISLHSERVDMNHIQRLVEMLSNKMFMEFKLMFLPAKMARVKEILSIMLELKKSWPFSLSISLLREPPKFDCLDKRYTRDNLQWQQEAALQIEDISKNSPHPVFRARTYDSYFWDIDNTFIQKQGINRGEYLNKGFFAFKNMYCAIGTRVLAIMPNGLCRGAQCDMAPMKYNIYDENPFLHEDFMSPVVCHFENCGCSANDFILKFADEAMAQAYVAQCRRRIG